LSVILIIREHSVREMETERGLDRNAALADMRYTFIEQVCRETVIKGQHSREKLRSERLDRVLTHKILAIPLFLCTMMAMFVITFGPFGSWLSDLVAMAMDGFGVWLGDVLTKMGISQVLISLVCDGIIAGVGGILTFLPQIALMQTMITM